MAAVERILLALPFFPFAANASCVENSMLDSSPFCYLLCFSFGLNVQTGIRSRWISICIFVVMFAPGNTGAVHVSVHVICNLLYLLTISSCSTPTSKHTSTTFWTEEM